MKQLFLLAGFLFSGLPATATTNWTEVQQIETTIERLGTRVLWMNMNTDRCARRGLLGFYRLSTRTVVMCQQRLRTSNEPLIDTLKHEGWHAVQELCNGGRAVLSDDKIRALLSESDKFNLRNYYDAGVHRIEAEARAIENVPTHAYLRGVNHYCFQSS